MRSVFRCLCIGMLVLLVAACGKSADEGSPSLLSHIPADTPFLYANLEPLDADTLDRMGIGDMAAAPELYARQLDQLIDLLEEDGDFDKDSSLIKGLRYTSDYLDTHDYAQIMDDSGMDKDGLYALYGLGLSPVLRGDLADSGKFSDWLDKFEKAFDFKLSDGEMDGTRYAYAALLDDQLRLVVVEQDEQFAIALIPTHDEQRLRTVLGLSETDADSLQETGVIDNLVTKYGYERQLLGYMDFTRLPSLITGDEQDPMLQALAAVDSDFDDELNMLADAACKVDFDRIVARTPQMSVGYTALEEDVQESELNLVLADDIIDAWRGAGTAVPGVGKVQTDALADVALVMPVSTWRTFALAQTRAINDNPFTCPAFVPLNQSAADAEREVAKLGLPPFADIKGVRVLLDAAPLPITSQSQLDMDALQQTKLSAIVALKDPAGVVNMMGAMLPMITSLDLQDDGKVRPLPADWGVLLGDIKAWLGMNAKALGASVGEGEDARLDDMLNTSENNGDTLAHFYVQAQLYADALQSIINLGQEAGKLEATDVQALENIIRMLAHVKDIRITSGMTADGLIVHSKIERP